MRAVLSVEPVRIYSPVGDHAISYTSPEVTLGQNISLFFDGDEIEDQEFGSTGISGSMVGAKSKVKLTNRMALSTLQVSLSSAASLGSLPQTLPCGLSSRVQIMSIPSSAPEASSSPIKTRLNISQQLSDSEQWRCMGSRDAYRLGSIERR
jgi:hypothetical protein